MFVFYFYFLLQWTICKRKEIQFNSVGKLNTVCIWPINFSSVFFLFFLILFFLCSISVFTLLYNFCAWALNRELTYNNTLQKFHSASLLSKLLDSYQLWNPLNIYLVTFFIYLSIEQVKHFFFFLYHVKKKIVVFINVISVRITKIKLFMLFLYGTWSQGYN